jgi:hypothetical protein
MAAIDLARWRLHAQLLRASTCGTPADVLAHVGAVQGQDYLPASWSLAQRCLEVRPSGAVDRALDEGGVLRTHTLRPTWHLVARDALPWLLAATSPRVHQLNKHYYRHLDVDEDLMARVRPLLDRLLAARHATREEVATALSDSGIEARGNRLAYVLMWAELEGWVVSGRRSGKQQTYAAYDERVPQAGWTREEALGRLAEVYVGSRGPATVKDLARWASLTLAEARLAREVAGAAIETVEVDGRTYLVGAGRSAPDRDVPQVDLVQQYDELGMSYSESRDVLVGHRESVFGPATTLVHAILLDGRLAGHWRYEREARGRPVEVQTWFYDDPAPADLLDDAVRRFADFAGGPVAHRSA